MRLEIDDILYVKSEGNYVEFFLPGKKILSRMSLKEALELLPSGLFQQVHRSYVVSRQKIERLSRDEIIIQGTRIPVGSNFQHTVEKWIAGVPND